MDEQLQGDWLDARLREEAPYLDDGGFTARVIQQLPAPQRRSFRSLIMICITLLASAATYAVSGGGQFMITAIDRLASLPILFICTVAICSGLIITGIAMAAALSKGRDLTFG